MAKAKATVDFNITGLNDALKSIKALDTYINNLEGSFRNAVSGSRNLEDSVNRFKRETGDAGKGTDKLGNSVDTLGKRLSIAAKKIITYRLAFGAFTEVTSVFSKIIDITGELDSTMQDLKKVLNASEGDFKKLEQQAFAMGEEFGRSGNEVAKSFLIFGQQGKDANAILEDTRAVLLAVSASTLTVSESVEAITAVMANFGDEISSSTEAVDKWAKVAAVAPVTAKDLANGMLAAGAAAKTTGVSMDELNGIIAAITESTRKSGKNIGNSLKTIFARVQRPEIIRQFGDLGVIGLKNVKTYRNFGDVLGDLNKSWGKLGQVQKFSIAVAASGVRRYNDFLALMANFDTFTRVTTESQGALGFAQKAAAFETEKYQRQVESLNTSMAELANEIGRNGLFDNFIYLKSIMVDFLAVFKDAGAAINRVIVVLGGFIIGAAIAKGVLGMVTGFIALKTAIMGATLASAGFALSLGVLTSVFALLAVGSAVYLAYAASTNRAKEAQDEYNESIKEGERSLERMKELEASTDKDATRKKFAVDDAGTSEIEKATRTLKTQTAIVAELEKKVRKYKVSLKDVATKNEGAYGVVVTNRDVLENQKEFFKANRALGLATKEHSKLTGDYMQSISDRDKALAGDDKVNLTAQKRLLSLKEEIDRLRETKELVDEFVAGKTTLPTVNFDFQSFDHIDLGTISSLTGNIKKNAFTDMIFKDDTGAKSNIQQRLTELISPESVQKLRDKVIKAAKETAEGMNDVSEKYRLDTAPSKALAKYASLEKQINSVGNALNKQRSLAVTLGKGFDTTEEKIKSYISKLGEIKTVHTNVRKNFDTTFVKATENGLDVTEAKIKKFIDNTGKSGSTLAINAFLSEKTVARLENAKNAVDGISETDAGLSLVEINNLVRKLVSTYKELQVSKAKSASLDKDVTGLISAQADMRKRNLIVINNTNKRIEQMKLASKANISILKSLDSYYKSMAGSSYVVLSNDKGRFEYADKQAKMQLEMDKIQASAIVSTKKLLGHEISIAELNKEQLELSKAQSKYESKIYESRIKQVDALLQLKASVRNNLATAVTSGLVGLKQTMQTRFDAELSLTERKMELEDDLKRARERNDSEAIESAKLGLRQLEKEYKNLISVGDGILDIFRNIANMNFDKQVENFVDTTLNLEISGRTAGDYMSSAILGSSEKAATAMYESIYKGVIDGTNAAGIGGSAVVDPGEAARNLTVDGTAFIDATTAWHTQVQSSLTKKAKETKLGIMDSSKFGASKFKDAILQGSKIASVLIGQAVGGGGPNAGLGASAGGILASSLALTGPWGIAAAIGLPLLGGLIGGSTDKEPDPLYKNNEALDRNTLAIENNNRLLELNRQFINAPTTFTAPPLSQGIGGGGGNVQNYINVVVNGSGSSEGVANDVYEATSRAFEEQFRNNGNTFNSFN